MTRTVLWLGTSDDVNARIPEGLRTINVAADRFTETSREPIKKEIRLIWPSANLPDLVDVWLQRYEPEMVVVHVNPYWFTYESVPAKVKRMFGRFGQPIAAAGGRLAARPKISESAAFRRGRQLAVRTFGGDLAIEPEACVALLGDLIRRIVAHEHTVLLVQGPHRPNDARGTVNGYRRAAAACRFVSDGLGDVCQRLHVTYWRRDIAERGDGPSHALLADGIHVSTVKQTSLGEQEAEWMLKAWHSAHPPEPPQA